MAYLRTSSQIAASVGETGASIRVRNIQSSANVGTDAWGREGKLQPVLITASVVFREPFKTAAVEDNVDVGTVHYGTLSKEILHAVVEFGMPVGSSAGSTLTSLLNYVVGHLSGTLFGHVDMNKEATYIIDPKDVKFLEVEIMLPKASLMGSGVSLRGSCVFEAYGLQSEYSMALKLHDLRIPTLIGLNDNERLAKQIVIVNVEIDPWTPPGDYYTRLEEVVTKTLEASSFKTLEALAAKLNQDIVECFVLPLAPNTPFDGNNSMRFTRVKITLEKPTAVPFADAPMIEMSTPVTLPLAPN